MRTESRCAEVPMLPTSKNVWVNLHWAERAKIKAEWREQVWGIVNQHPRLPRPAIRVTVTAVVGWNKPGPLPDQINLEMLHEVVADSLTKKLGCGIIPDDQTQYVAGKITLMRSETAYTVLRIVAEYGE